MHPVLINIFGFPLYSYGALLMVAFVLGIALMVHLGEKQGHARESVIEMALWVIIIGIVGCRLGFVAQNMDYYMANPLQILNLRQGGLTLVTGLMAGCLALAVYFRRRNIPFMNVLDLVSGPGLVGMAVGRVGCILHGCCYGKMCSADVMMALTYPDPSIGGPRYPVQVYELVLDVMLLALVLWYMPRRKFAGQAFYLTFGGYGIIRTLTEFYREGDLMGPLTLAQWTSLLFAFLCLLGWFGLFGKQPLTSELGLDGEEPESKSKKTSKKKKKKKS